jgi:hypothetical protein
MSCMLAPETLANKVFAITRECQDRGFLTRIELSGLEDTLTDILADDHIDVVVREEIVDDTIDVVLTSVWPSQRGDVILQRYSQLAGKPLDIMSIDLPEIWRT